eukprot:gene24661-33132_t
MGVFEFLLDLILQPGSSLTLIPAINVTVLLLLVLLVCLLYYSSIAIVHILVMSTLSLGLLFSVNWFYYEYTKAISEMEAKKDRNS